ncbi:MAG: hypothetical protein KTR31_39535 [Myxococcales bacterium]|nr:hypothetical protein [Myxococcales bacterium]
MSGIEAIVALACSGMCCLSLAAILLVVVFLVYRRNSGNGSEADAEWAAVADAGGDGPMLGEQLDPQPAMMGELEAEPVLVSAADQPTDVAGADSAPLPLGSAGAVEPRRQPRSSGQTIIAFDDDDDDW